MLKRLLPFMLTLLVGTALGSLTNPLRPRLGGATDLDRAESEGLITLHYTHRAATSRSWAIIHSQPLAKYTEAARSHHTAGTVVLRIRLSYDGTVTAIQPSQTLPDGLTESAIEAARKIQFTPAMRDGQPLSIWAHLAYTFNGRQGDGHHGFNYATDTSSAVSDDGEDWRVVYE